MISLKKYLDLKPEERAAEPVLNDVFTALLASYRAALLAVGNSGVRACPASGSDLQHALARLERALFARLSVTLVEETQAHVEKELLRWDEHTAEYFQAKANEVKELLIVLAQTAENMGKRDTRYTSHFSELTAQLHSIADLDDLTLVKTSLVKQAAALETYVETMALESRESVAQLQKEVISYETKLKAVEQLAVQDALTSIANRRGTEQRIEWRIAHQETFCIVILDMNRFKLVNDTHGHLIGDDLLRQFAGELRTNIRSSDQAGRWGGDEFVVLFEGDLEMAKTQVERLRRWAFGEYTIQLEKNAAPLKVQVDASIGLAQWKSGETMAQLIARADASMYSEKQKAKAHGASR